MSKNKNLKGGAPPQQIKHGRIRQSAPNRSTVSSSPITQTINQQHTTNVQQQDVSDTSGDNVLQGGAPAQRVGHGRVRNQAPDRGDEAKRRLADQKAKEDEKEARLAEERRKEAEERRKEAEERRKLTARAQDIFANATGSAGGKVRYSKNFDNRKKTSFCSVL
jgi:hypothetical protein